jgi:hypothetical protein
MKVTKEFIDTFLKIINLQADSKVRSKQGYGRFEYKVYPSAMNINGEYTTEFELNFIPRNIDPEIIDTRVHNCFRKRFHSVIALDESSSFYDQFYQDIVDWCLFSVTTEGTSWKCISARDLCNKGLN